MGSFQDVFSVTKWKKTREQLFDIRQQYAKQFGKASCWACSIGDRTLIRNNYYNYYNYLYKVCDVSFLKSFRAVQPFLFVSTCNKAKANAESHAESTFLPNHRLELFLKSVKKLPAAVNMLQCWHHLCTY